MHSVAKIREHNHRVCELIKVVSVLVRNEQVVGTRTVFDLLTELAAEVEEQFDLEDKSLYSHMLTHQDHQVKATATRFLSGESELKRIFCDYAAKWCKQFSAVEAHPQAFARDTEQVFQMLLDRGRHVDEELYPLAARVQQDKDFRPASGVT